MRTKKADSFGLQFIVVLIIVIIFVVIYFVWMKDFRIFGENLSDYTICKNSNLENAKMKLKIGNQPLAERVGNRCKTEYIEVPKDKELDLTTKKMAGCWDMYLEGKEELFETGGIFSPEDNTFCAICSVLDFEEKEELTGLTSYLMENKVPNKEGLTYYEYFNRVKVTKENIREVKNTELTGKLKAIDTEIPQAVIFIEGKDVNPGSLTGQSSVVEATKGSAIGVGAGLVALVGFGLCSTGIGCVLGVFLVAGAGVVGGTTGYLIGSDYNPDLDTRILLWPYTNEDLNQLDCTILEGRDRLDIIK